MLLGVVQKPHTVLNRILIVTSAVVSDNASANVVKTIVPIIGTYQQNNYNTTITSLSIMTEYVMSPIIML